MTYMSSAADRRMLDRFRHLRGLMVSARSPGRISDIDRELILVMTEIDRAHGPGAGERFMIDQLRNDRGRPLERDTHED